MSEKYEQMELDTRPLLQAAIQDEATPMEELAEAAFQEAEPADAGEHEMEE